MHIKNSKVVKKIFGGAEPYTYILRIQCTKEELEELQINVLDFLQFRTESLRKRNNPKIDKYKKDKLDELIEDIRKRK